MLSNIINSKSKTFLAFCFCFLLGVLAISLVDIKINFVYFYISLFIILSFFIYFWSNKKIRLVLFCCAVFVLGISRYLLAFTVYNLPEGKTEFTGYVAEEPDIRQGNVNYIIKSKIDTGYGLRDMGRIYLKQNLYPRYSYGDVLKINCDLRKPEPLENNFRYDMYLAKQGVFMVCLNGKVEKIGNGQGNFIYSKILQLKNKVAGQVIKLWHEPYASFMAGLLYGYRGGLGDLNDDFNRTGLTHIVAISGYNISIIATILITLFVYLLVPRKKAFWLVIGGIILFVIFTGANASVVRAGIMGILVLLARQIGRLSRFVNVIAFTSVLMVLANPLILVWDAGFQLSFVAMLGITFIPRSRVRRDEEESFGVSGRNNTKIFCASISRFFERFLTSLRFLRNELSDTVIVTFSAIIATLPLILFQFGRLSIVAPLVNILVLWIIPFLMLFGFLAVIISFVYFPLGQIVAWFAYLGLKYVVIVVQWCSGLKFAAMDISISWWGMVGLYIILVYLIFKKPNPKLQ